ncbi:MAG: PadR family transcriptional regulator [Oscillospiraceae bacterium]|nr:PadR family transcriptional regulator [Oscillospiraceae bacterium]
MDLNEWRSQLKRGTLAFSILLMIQKGECYGYEMISRLESNPVLSAKESTIYPLLRRLLKEGLLSSVWRESAEGLPPRKYYALTEKGRDHLNAMSREWDELLSAINEIRGE